MLKVNSIRLKIIPPLVGFMGAIGIFISIYFPDQQANLINEMFRQRLKSTVDTLTLGFGISIALGSGESAQETLNLVMDEGNLAFLLAFDPDGDELTTKGELDKTQIEFNALVDIPTGEFREIGHYLFYKGVMQFAGEVYGTAVIGVDTTERENTIRETILITSLLSAVLTAISSEH